MKIAEAKPPSKKYLSAASEDVERWRSKATSTYSPIERISRPKKMVMRSLAWVIRIAPELEASARMWNSTPETRSRIAQSCATKAVRITLSAITPDATTEKSSSTTACAMVTEAPARATQRHWKKLTTMLAVAAVMTVDVA